MKTESDEYGRSYSIIASNLINEIVRDDQTFPASCGYHRKCYQLFANKKIWNRQRREVCDLCMMKIIKIFPGICYLPSIFTSVVLLFIFQSITVYKGWRTFDFDEIQ